ncbi:helix-turn-helix domain-containing protein [Streptomyces durmitorensis]|uniref:Helix-turn-helix domain-containing protein n=1 Tax=Streptomyces durmitorensis TaxID=319947 RepID=A0ABY4PLX0_9ACTN|nr:helix-turn-helix domain-containing protein [Streptomyces durmitorensis]UQT54795.1 helix-turn-helix domain-containing protein [Streptomyces durmitorensis]
MASGATPEQLGEPLDRAREQGADAERLAQVERARTLALRVQELMSRQHSRQTGLAALIDTARELTRPYDLGSLLNVIARRARFLLGLDMAWLSIHAPTGGESVVHAADGHVSMVSVGMRVPTSGGLGNLVTERAAPVWTSDYLNEDEIPRTDTTHGAVRAEGLRAVLGVPLRRDATILGVLYVGHRQVRPFTADEITLMSSLGDLAAVAIEKAQRLGQAQEEVSELRLDASRAEDSFTSAQQLNLISTRLIDLVLCGGDLHALMNEAGELLKGTLLVRDPSGTNLTATHIPDLDEAELRKAAMGTRPGRKPVMTPSGTWVCPISAGEELLGTLILATDGPLDEQQTQIIALTAQVAAVSLLLQQSTSLAELQVRSEVFQDLIHGEQLSARQLDDRARRLAVDLSVPHVLVVARPESDPQGRGAFWASSYAHQRSGLKSVESDGIVLLLPGADAGATGRTVATEFTAALGHPVTVGSAGPVTSAKALSEAFQEAQRCLDALTALGSTGGAASSRELGFLGLLLSDEPNAGGFVSDTVGPVLEYDAQQGTELTRTLETYFSLGGSATRTADALHVHPNTVARRLERITELLGERWQDSTQRLEVQIALRLNRIRHTVRARGGGLPARR